MPPMMRSFSISSRTMRPGSTRSGQWATCTSSGSAWRSGGKRRSGRSRASRAASRAVVPTGEVNSRITTLPQAQHRRDRVGRRVDIAEVGRPVGVERRRHRDDERVRRLGLPGRAQLAQGRRGAQQHVEIGLGEIGLPGIYRVDDVGIDVDADHVDAAAREGRGGRQADIAQPDHAYGLYRVIHVAGVPDFGPAAALPPPAICCRPFNTQTSPSWQAHSSDYHG